MRRHGGHWATGFLAACGFFALSSAAWAQGNVAPSIVTHPAAIQAYVGESATFTALVAGTAPIGFQWRKNGVAIANAIATTYAIGSVALTDSADYDLVATNSFGTATTLPALLNVSKRPQTLAFNPPTGTVAAGSGVVLNATASSNLPVSYALVSGNALLTGRILSGTGGAVVIRASQAGDATFAAAEPVERTITFVAGALSPFITNPPTDQTVTAGTTATFRATAIGTPAPTYQWQKDGVALPEATTAILTLTSTTLADAGRYTVTATNLIGTSTASASLAVRAAPMFSTMPESATASAGTAVTFSAAATGFPTPAFQWRKNGAAIAGATNATLHFNSVTAADAGRYEVVGTNALGSATSDAATLTVNARDFSGTYFGAQSAGGDFALLVRPNRTAAFIGRLDSRTPGTATAFLELPVDLAGRFSRTITIDGRPAMLLGEIDEVAGRATVTVPGSGVEWSGARINNPDSGAATAGLYFVARVGSAAGHGHVLLAADGQVFTVLAFPLGPDSTRGSLKANGRFESASAAATFDFGFANGELSGTVRSQAGGTETLVGAHESLLGRERLVNVSVRAATANAAPLITGFVITGTAPKQVLIRAAGPAIGLAPFNVAGALADPTLQVFRGSNAIAQNDEWGTPAANGTAVTAAASRAGAFPFRAGSNDAAIVQTLAPGPYTVQIGGGNGNVLAEIYEVLANNETAGARRLVNLSARGLVAPGAPMIAGFVIGGTAPKRMLIRGVGPRLGTAPFNVAGTLPNPQLTLLRGTTVVKTNDDWSRDPDATLIREAAARAAAFALPAQGTDAAMLLYLAPGAYTAQLSGPTNANQQNGTGIVLVEIYESAP